MNVAKWVLCAAVRCPFWNWGAFVTVAAAIGWFGWALGLVLAGSFAGLLTF